MDKVEKALGIENLYLDVNGNLVNHLIQALKAHALYRKDKEYIVRDGEVLIVDEFTGRVLEGRRYSEGLHQAIEAKEGLRDPRGEPDPRHDHPPELLPHVREALGHDGHGRHRGQRVREDLRDRGRVDPDAPADGPRSTRTTSSSRPRTRSTDAVVEDIAEAHERGQPVLVGTISVEISEMLSGMLTRRGVPHNVLNAKNHAREAEIIQDAGQQGAVTIATNMAGRGVDIKLGEGVAELGGLYVLGTERHESRRIDNQLRGRSGPPGRPGPLALLPLGRGRPDPHLLRRPHLQDPRPPRAGRRPADRGEDAHQDRRGRPEEGRGAELQHPQARARVRRRAQQAARGHLLASAAGCSRARTSASRRATGSPRRWCDVVDQFDDEDSLPADWDLDGAVRARSRLLPDELTLADIRATSTTRTTRSTREELLDRLEDDAMDAYDAARGRSSGADARSATSSAGCCSSSSTSTGASTSTTWTTCARASTCARSARRTRSRSTASRATTMFDEMMDLVKSEFVRYMFHIQVERAPEAEEQQRRRGGLLATRATRSRASTARGRRRGRPTSEDAEAEQGRRRRGRGGAAGAGDEDKVGPQRPVPVRLRQEVQEVPRGLGAPGRPRRMSTDSTRSLDDLVQRAARLRERAGVARRLPRPRRPRAPGRGARARRWATRASGTTRPARPRVSAEHAAAQRAPERLPRALRRDRRAGRAGRAAARGGAGGRARPGHARRAGRRPRPRGRPCSAGLEEARLFSGEHDAGDAVVTINAGEGGTDAQDWAEMLLRMYLRWAERRGLQTDLKEVQEGTEAGIKTATFTVARRPTPTGCCRPSAACTGWCACRRSTRPTAARPRSPPSRSPRW